MLMKNVQPHHNPMTPEMVQLYIEMARNHQHHQLYTAVQVVSTSGVLLLGIGVLLTLLKVYRKCESSRGDAYNYAYIGYIWSFRNI